MKVVISQSMYFPWIGMLEEIKLADVFVHYDDVQFAKGFCNRVEVRSKANKRWITVPTMKHGRATRIKELQLDTAIDWQTQHRNVLQQYYRSSSYYDDMIGLFDRVVSMSSPGLSTLTRTSMLALAEYFGISKETKFISSDSLGVGGHSTDRLLGICKKLGATQYITGHGARNYLDHSLFEEYGIEVRYMDYQKVPYQQAGEIFDPFVSALDLVANCGKDGARYICSGTLNWKDFIDGSH